MTKHPGSDCGWVQRLVLDRIGTRGSYHIGDRRMRKTLLKRGLIVEIGDTGEYEMPIHVHIQWCEYWAEYLKQSKDEA